MYRICLKFQCHFVRTATY